MTAAASVEVESPRLAPEQEETSPKPDAPKVEVPKVETSKVEAVKAGNVKGRSDQRRNVKPTAAFPASC